MEQTKHPKFKPTPDLTPELLSKEIYENSILMVAFGPEQCIWVSQYGEIIQSTDPIARKGHSIDVFALKVGYSLDLYSFDHQKNYINITNKVVKIWYFYERFTPECKPLLYHIKKKKILPRNYFLRKVKSAQQRVEKSWEELQKMEKELADLNLLL